MSDEHDWLGDLPGVKDIQDAAGITYPRRARLRFEGVTVADDPVNGRTVVSVPGPDQPIPALTVSGNPETSEALPTHISVHALAAVQAADVAALRAANPLLARIALVADLAGGLFYWDSSSTDADDGVRTVQPSGWSGAGRYKRDWPVSEVNVLKKAKADGLTDDSAVFAEAIAALPATGGTVVVPAGTYYLASPLTFDKPIRFVGQGRGLSVLKGPGDGSGTAIDLGAGNVVIERLSFTGFKHCLVYSGGDSGAESIEIIDCEFTDNAGRALTASSGSIPLSRVRIKSCRVANHSGSDQVGGFVLGSDQLDDVVVEGNTIENLSSSSGGVLGISIGANDGSGTMVNSRVAHNLVRNLSGAGETHAILVYGERTIIGLNIVDTVEASAGDCEAIYTKARMGFVALNAIRNGGSTSGGAIQIKGSPRSSDGTPGGYTMRVLGNAIYDDRAGVDGYGISVHRGELDISHNVIEGCEGAGVYLAPPHSEHVSVTDNELIGIRAPAAIEIRNSKRYVTIKDNRIHSQASGEAIRVLIATNADTASDITIEGNKVYGFASGRGITLTPQVGRIERVTIMGNTLDVPGPFGAVQIDGAHVASVYDIVCINNRYLNVGPSANLTLTQSSIPGAFPILRDNAPFDRTSFFGAPPVTQPDITGGTEEEQIDSIKSVLATLGLARDLTWVPTRSGAKSWLYGSNPGVTLETSTDPHQFQEVPDAGAIGGSFEQLDTDHQPKVSTLWTPSPVLLFDGDQFLAHTESADKFTFLHHDGVHEALSGIRFRLTATTGNSRFLFGTRSTASRGFFVFVANNGQLTASFHDGSAQQNFSTGSGAIALNTDYSLVCRKTKTSFSMWLNNTHLLTQDFAAVSPSTDDPQFTLHVGASAGGGIPMVGLVSDLVLFASTDADELPSHSVLRAYLDLQKYTPAP